MCGADAGARTWSLAGGINRRTVPSSMAEGLDILPSPGLEVVMRDTFTARVSSLAVILAALSTLGAVIYLSVRGQQVNEYLAGLAGLTIGALLPSPLSSSGATPGSTPAATTGTTTGTSRSGADLAR